VHQRHFLYPQSIWSSFIGVAAIVLGVVAMLMRARRGLRTQGGVVGFLTVAVVVVVILGW
jgi:heme/copper-type cytochrome/quinol oxidase subunit 4